MVFGRKISRRFSISEWDDAPPDPHVLSPEGGAPGGHTDSSSCGGEQEDVTTSLPEMNLSEVYSALQRRESENSSGSLEVANGARRGGQGGHATFNKKGASFRLFHRTKTMEANDDSTVAPSSSASRTSYSSSAGTNIWNKLLTNAEGVWDGLDGKDVFNDDDSFLSIDDPLDVPSCTETSSRAMRRIMLGWWYETRHFFKTVWNNPLITLISLAAFGILCGVGMSALNSERDAYIKKQQGMVTFIASETGAWFASEFRKAMIPLYSVQQAVQHSGYFDELAEKVGDYPLHVIPATDYITNPTLEDVPKGMIFRNLTGICDDPQMQQRWHDIVAPVKKDNGLDDGSNFAYRLAPRGTFCLFDHEDPNAPDDNFGFDTSISGKAKFWKKVTSDIFGIQDPFAMPGMGSGGVGGTYSIFGPFGQPDKEVVCGHLPIYTRPSDVTSFKPLNIHGVDVEGGWGFVATFIDWRQLKERSDIYATFNDCQVEFELKRKEDGVELARSPKADLLTNENSITIETESMHGIWVNRVGRLDGWSPPWYPGAVAGVVIGSLIIGLLVASTLVERQLHRDLVGKMLPKKAVTKLQRGQTVLEKYNLVTIFFSDIVGFTSMAGSMRPMQVMKMLNELYTELDKLVAKHNVYKVETIGDAYMVVGGAPTRISAPLAAERVALFAIDAVNFVKSWRTQDGDQVFIRAGLASGATVAGVVGQAMPRYCFFGDTVNFASRMESTSKKMRIQCADITYRLLMDSPNKDFKLIKRMEGDVAGIQVKGKGHVITYWVEGSTSRAGNVQNQIGTKKKNVEPHGLGRLEEEEEVYDDAEQGRAVHERSSTDEYDEFMKVLYSSGGTDEPNDINMHTSDEIYAAVTAQDWRSLSHASGGPLVAATDDNQKLIVLASTLLEHHLARVHEARDADTKLPYSMKEQIGKFVADVAATYGDAKFHNFSHALHVTMNMNKLVSMSLDNNPLNGFSLVFSALVHDAGHTGMSNKILSDTHHPLSEKYDEGVPLAERESIAIALGILFRPEYEELRVGIFPDVFDKIQFAKTLFQSILVTDIATPGRVQLGVKRFEVAQDAQGAYDCSLCPLAHYLDSVLEGVGLEKSDKEDHPKEFIVTHCGLGRCVRNEHLMLCSDVGHLMQGWNNFIKWNYRLYKELHTCFKKGLCSDPRTRWFQDQIGFLDHYIIPLAKRSSVYFDEDFGRELAENAAANRELWVKHGVRATQIMVGSATENEIEIESLTLLRLYELESF
mmetsp:Transcript_1825/g.4566  ORF Transcript_1825/g.4566 Transcript_1825/m.4566 type:complete len:1245 (+) Transcript_1825:180-3914(+)